MKERPILFAGEMVRAVLDGTKTQTRRPIKFPQRMIDDGQLPQIYHGFGDWPNGSGHEFYVAGKGNAIIECPFGSPGDHLWVRETWAKRVDTADGSPKAKHYLLFRSDSDPDAVRDELNWHDWGGKWKPSIHMPRWASRITLEVTGVRVDRLQEISFEDCRAEGCSPDFKITAYGCREADCNGMHFGEKYHFEALWNSLAKPGFTWKDNPWVWAISFKRITPPERKFSDAMIAAGREG